MGPEFALLPWHSRSAQHQIPKLSNAVAAQSGKSDALISQRSARAPFILIFDASGNLIETYENPITRDFGPALAAWLGEKEVDKLIGGHICRNLGRNLDQYQITGIEGGGTADNAVKDALN